MRCLRIDNRNNPKLLYCVSLMWIISFVLLTMKMGWKKLLWCRVNVFFSTIIINKINNIIHIRDRQISVILTIYITRGVFRNFSRGGGLFFYLFKVGLSTLWGLKTPRINSFTGPGGLSPHSPPEYVPVHNIMFFRIWQ